MVQEGPREEKIVESDTEEEEILQQDAVPLRIRIPGARAQGRPRLRRSCGIRKRRINSSHVTFTSVENGEVW